MIPYVCGPAGLFSSRSPMGFANALGIANTLSIANAMGIANVRQMARRGAR